MRRRDISWRVEYYGAGVVSADESGGSITNADDEVDVLFHGKLRVEQPSQITENVDQFHDCGTTNSSIVVAVLA